MRADLLRPAGSASAVSTEHLRLLLVLVLSTGVPIGMFALRVLYTGGAAHLGLVWNLFLAWIPLWLAIPMLWLEPRRGWRGMAVWLGLGCLWLLFLPNAPYLLTDLIHLSPRYPVHDRPIRLLAEVSPGGLAPVWYDAVLVFAFAWNGMLLGFASL